MKKLKVIKMNGGIAKWAMMLLCVCSLSLGFVSCSDDDDDDSGNANELVGEWEATSTGGQTLTIEFHNNGTLSGTWNGIDFSGTYTVDEAEETYSYSVTFEDGTTASDQDVDYSLSGRSLYFTFDGVDLTAQGTGGSTADSGIVGTWVSEWLNDDGKYRRYFTFKADGTFESDLQDYGDDEISQYDHETGHWETYGNKLELDYDDTDTYVYEYSISGNTMTFKYKGATIKLQRIVNE